MNLDVTAVAGSMATMQISDATEMVTFCLGDWSFEVPRKRLKEIDEHFETGQLGSFVEANCKKIILDCPFVLGPKAQGNFAVFMNEGKITVSLETAFDLLVIAVTNNIPSLREACADFLFANANAEDDRVGYTALLEFILAHEDSTLGSKFVDTFIGRSCHKQSNGHYVAALECILSIKKKSKTLEKLKWYFFERMANKAMMWAKLHFTGRDCPKATELYYTMQRYREDGFAPSLSSQGKRKITVTLSDRLYRTELLSKRMEWRGLSNPPPFSCEWLDITSSASLTDTDLQAVCTTFGRDLGRLSVSSCPLITSVASFAFKNLVNLEIKACDLTDKGLSLLSPTCSETLRYLDVSNNRRITTLEGIAFSKLERVNASGTALTFIGLEALSLLCRATVKEINLTDTPVCFDDRAKVLSLFDPSTKLIFAKSYNPFDF